MSHCFSSLGHQTLHFTFHGTALQIYRKDFLQLNVFLCCFVFNQINDLNTSVRCSVHGVCCCGFERWWVWGPGGVERNQKRSFPHRTKQTKRQTSRLKRAEKRPPPPKKTTKQGKTALLNTSRVDPSSCRLIWRFSHRKDEEDVQLWWFDHHHHPDWKPEEYPWGSADARELPLRVSRQLQGVCVKREAQTSGGEFSSSPLRTTTSDLESSFVFPLRFIVCESCLLFVIRQLKPSLESSCLFWVLCVRTMSALSPSPAWWYEENLLLNTDPIKTVSLC